MLTIKKFVRNGEPLKSFHKDLLSEYQNPIANLTIQYLYLDN